MIDAVGPTVRDIAVACASGRRAPSEVLAETMAMVADGDPAIWVTTRTSAEVEARARALESHPDPATLPLFGVPVAVKDNIDVAGLPTSAACPAFAYSPDRSAPAVALLERAGAVVVGKTNMDQFATGLVGTRSPHGAPRNPRAPGHVPGGSSSGSAVAVASGIVPLALGTDTAGSGRVPAALNGIVGAKPTRGLVSTTGVVPACRSLDTVSTFATTVADARLVHAVLAQHDPSDHWARPRGQRDPLPTVVPRAVGVPDSATRSLLDPLAADVFHAHLDRVRAAGLEVVEVDLTSFLDASSLLYDGPWIAERIVAFGRFVRDHPELVDPVLRDIVTSAPDRSAVDVFRGMDRLRQLQASIVETWATVDALLVPSVPTFPTLEEVVADPHGPNGRLGLFTNFVNLLDLAALAVPLDARADGLPAGATLIGPALSDGLLHLVGGRLLGEPAPTTPAGLVPLAVVGAHLRGQPLHHQLVERDAVLRQRTTTAPTYQLFALAGTEPAKPALVRGRAGRAIEVEVYEMSSEAFGTFTAAVPPPLAIGSVELADGSTVPGFVCEPVGLEGATDISAFGGWRAWLESRRVGDGVAVPRG